MFYKIDTFPQALVNLQGYSGETFLLLFSGVLLCCILCMSLPDTRARECHKMKAWLRFLASESSRTPLSPSNSHFNLLFKLSTPLLAMPPRLARRLNAERI